MKINAKNKTAKVKVKLLVKKLSSSELQVMIRLLHPM